MRVAYTFAGIWFWLFWIIIMLGCIDVIVRMIQVIT